MNVWFGILGVTHLIVVVSLDFHQPAEIEANFVAFKSFDHAADV